MSRRPHVAKRLRPHLREARAFLRHHEAEIELMLNNYFRTNVFPDPFTREYDLAGVVTIARCIVDYRHDYRHAMSWVARWRSTRWDRWFPARRRASDVPEPTVRQS